LGKAYTYLSCSRTMPREALSPEGLRPDGRRPGEIRRIACEIGQFHRADGSVSLEQGNTKIIASVYGPSECKKRADALHDRCIVTCEYTVASFATAERKNFQRGDRRTKELGLLIKQTFESAILLHLFPRSQISIFIQVIADDGGALPVAINAASVALINAGVPMKDFVTACSVGFSNNTPLLDLNFVERSYGGPLINLAIYPQSETVTLLQMENKLFAQHLEEVLRMGREGCKKTYEVLKDKVQGHSFGLLHTRGFLAS